MPTLNPLEAFERLKSGTIQEVSAHFPHKGRKQTLEAERVWIDDDKDIDDLASQLDAKTKQRSWTVPVKAALVLKDNATGNVIDRKEITVSTLPKITRRYSYIVEGNEYQVDNLFRLKYGVYPRVKANGELTAQINTPQPVKSSLDFDPESRQMVLHYRDSKVPLHPVLKMLGVGDEDVRKAWGAHIHQANAGAKYEPSIRMLHKAVTGKTDSSASLGEMEDHLRNFFHTEATLDPKATKSSLGVEASSLNGHVMLHTGAKLLGISKGTEKPTDRDSLEYKDLLSTEDFITERIRRSSKEIKRTLNNNIDRKQDIRMIVPPAVFRKPIRSFFSTSSLAQAAPQINPLEMVSGQLRTTIIAPKEGGLAGERLVTDEMAFINPSTIGFLDPIQTPECYDAETQVFTEKGWVLWEEVTSQTRLACRIDGRLEFHKPQSLFRSQYSGLMYGYQNKKLDYLVTPNHRMFSRPMEGSVWVFKTAEEVHGTSRTYLTTHSPYIGEEQTTYTLASHTGRDPKTHTAPPVLIEDWAEFLGWFLSEGSVSIDPTVGRYQVHISQNEEANPDNYREIEGLLRRLPFDDWCVVTTTEGKKVGFSKGWRELAENLAAFGSCNDKYIPEYMFSAPVHARELLLDAMLRGDGRVGCRRENGREYDQQVLTTTSPRLAYDTERLAIGLGHSVKVAVYQDLREERYLDVYEVRLLVHTERSARKRVLHSERGYYTQQYTGPVYCAEVPGGLLLVRRGDSTGFWCGNSKRTGITLHLPVGVKKEGKDLKTRVYDVKSQKDVWVSPAEIKNSVVTFSDQVEWKNGKPVPRAKLVKVSDVGGEFEKKDFSEVRYVLRPMKTLLAPSTNMVPFLSSVQGNRSMMAAKQMEQSVALKHREAPLVQSLAGQGVSFEEAMGQFSAHHSPHEGTVVKVEPGMIHIKDTTGKLQKVHIYDHFPLNDNQAFLHATPKVKEGDQVKQGHLLADTNYTHGGTLALGTTLRTAYMPYKGLNFEDGIVISESAAKKLTSEHLHRQSLFHDKATTTDKAKFMANFPSVLPKEKASKLDANGVIKVGETVETDDVLISALRKKELTSEEKILKSMGVFAPAYHDSSVKWGKINKGVVTRVVKSGNNITVHVKTDEAAQEGDKIAGRFGNKGIITKVLPDHEMPHDSKGEPVHVLLSPAGVPSRINPGQLLETAAGKIAMKTGKPYLVDNFHADPNHDNAEKVAKDLAAHGLKETDELFDPKTGKKLGDVFTGYQYTIKARHQVEKKSTVRSGGVDNPYDSEFAPRKGDKKSAQAMDVLGMYSMLSHGARANLREMATWKAGGADKKNNEDFWRALQAGDPLPAPQPTFAFNKFTSLIKGLGVNVDRHGHSLHLSPMTDKHVEALSSYEIKDPAKMVRAKDLRPEEGGLFSSHLGGMDGKKWGHIRLHEPMPNPVFEGPIKHLLGLKQTDFDAIINGEVEHGGKRGPQVIGEMLKSINVTKELDEARAKITRVRGANRDRLNKKIKYLQALKELDTTPHEAYMQQLVPVLPPIMRPMTQKPNGDLDYEDLNHVYKFIGAHNSQLADPVRAKLPDEENAKLRADLYGDLKDLSGLGGPLNKKATGGYRGIIQKIEGKTTAGTGQPKEGFFQKKIMRRQQDLSMRSIIVPEPSLGLDEVGIPRKAAMEVYKPFVFRELRRSGYKGAEAQKAIRENHAVANKALDIVVNDRPIIMKRDPTLHKFGVMAFKPRLVAGKAIQINPLVVSGFNADFDGDAMSGYVPISEEAVQEARKMMPSANLFSQAHGKVMYMPGQDMVLGNHLLSEWGKETRHSFADPSAAVKAHKEGKIGVTDVVKINGKKTTVGRLAIASTIGQANLSPGTEKTSSVKEADASLNPIADILHDPKWVANKKNIGKVLTQVAQQDPGSYGKVAGGIKDLGDKYAFESGFSYSMKDLLVNKKVRNAVLSVGHAEEAKIRAKKLPKDHQDAAIISTWMEVNKHMDGIMQAEADKSRNAFRMQERSGSRGKWDQVKQIVSAPVLTTDGYGNPLPYVIGKSFSEGLDSADYWTHLHAARKGTIGRAKETEEPGALSKQIIQSTLNNVVTLHDCGTQKGISMSPDEPDIHDRYLAKDISYGKGKVLAAGTPITSDVTKILRTNKIHNVVVRSPLTCEHGGGMCAKCYGHTVEGTDPHIGMNLGAIAAQTLGEPATQMSMDAFHCNHADSLVFVRKEDKVFAISMEGFFHLVDSPVVLDGDEEIKEVTGWEAYSADWTPITHVRRHAPTRPMVALFAGGLVTICQDNHPVCAAPNLVACANCGYHRLKKPSPASKAKRHYCPKCHMYQDPVEVTQGGVEYLSPAELEEKRFHLCTSVLPAVFSPEVPPPELPAYFSGMFLAEGSVIYKGTKAKKPYAVNISQKDGPVKSKLLSYIPEEWNPRPSKKCVMIHDLELGTQLESLFGRYSSNKAFPSDFIGYPNEWLAEAICGLIDGDGTIKTVNDGPEQISVDTTSFELAQQIVMICYKLGIQSGIVLAKNKRLTRHQGFRVTLRMTKAAQALLSPSLKVQKLTTHSPDQKVSLGSWPLLSKKKSVLYTHDYVYDLTTEAGTLFVGGIYSHNTGGVVSTAQKGKQMDKIQALKDLVSLPKTLKGAATISTQEGKITKVVKDPAGGWAVYVNNQRHYVPLDRGLAASAVVGAEIKKGTPLSGGRINPHELLEVSGMNAVRNHLTNEIHRIYGGPGDKALRKNIEVVVRSITDLAEVTHSGDSEHFLPGDKTSSAKINDENKRLIKEGKDPIKYNPVLAGVNVLPQTIHEDWMARLNHWRLRDTILEGSARGWKSTIHGTNPIPAYAYGAEFGRAPEDTPGAY